ncbi:MAG: phosphatase PAP2 family protein [Desulfobulbales bacterium]
MNVRDLIPKWLQILMCTTKQAGELLVFTCIVNFVFSVPVYANDDIELAGDIIRVILPLTAAGMTIFQNDHEGLIQFSKSFLSTVGVTYALQYSIDTTSPNGEEHSFPSGHTSTAFSGASFLQRRYGWKYGIPAYAAASFVGWSRIESDNHYLKDVLAGGAIGIITTYIFTDPYQKEIIATPFVGGGQYGMLLSTTF